MKKNISIIGGGLTGLLIAYRLSEADYKVSVYEKNKELGGLVSSFKQGSIYLEKSYHHIFKGDKNIIQLINELDLGSKLKWYTSSIANYMDRRLYPFMSAVDLLKFSPLKLKDRIRMGGVALYLQKENRWQKFEKEKAWKWMKKWGGESAYLKIWQLLLRGKFHNLYKQVSMAWLWARINTRAKSAKNGGKEELGYLDGGFYLIIDELVKRIKNKGGRIFLNKEIKRISQLKDSDKIIASIDSNNFAKIVEREKLDIDYIKKLKSIKYLAYIGVVFKSKQSLSDYYWHNINDSKSPFLAFIQHSNLVGKERYGNS
ncbi:hypothetical protein DRH14_02055, partial [Candidatus Shapirobacteria bacterium]